MPASLRSKGKPARGESRQGLVLTSSILGLLTGVQPPLRGAETGVSLFELVALFGWVLSLVGLLVTMSLVRRISNEQERWAEGTGLGEVFD